MQNAIAPRASRLHGSGPASTARPGLAARLAWALLPALAALGWSTGAQAAPFGPETCKPGYVWREACGPNDHVCVTGAVRAQAAADNSLAASRRVGNGAYGPDTCRPGYVWREACGPQDHVCVAGATRSQAAADNAQAAARFDSPPQLWDVLTQHNDAARNGAQLNETVLTPANVRPASFGRLLERSVDGQVITQPLYESNQWLPGKGLRNVVYVATRKNMVYAFDADDLNPDPNGGQLWAHPVQVAAATPVPNMCSETIGPVGINATPVIDRASDTMYLSARHSDGSIWIHALDVASGLPKAGTPGAVRINPPGFQQGLELSRAALLLQNGAVFVAFSALNCDNAGWRGWVMAYRAPDLQPVGVFSTASPSSPGAGIWQSGNGLVGDGQNVYFQTGNRQGGTAPGSTLDEGFVKLAVGAAPFYGLSLAGHYTVSNREALNGGDTDLGSGGPILLPGGRLVGGGKQGKLYVLDSATMAPSQNPPSGGSVPGGSDGFQAFVNTWHDDPAKPACTNVSLLGRDCYMLRSRYEDSEMFGPNIHGGPIFWRSANAGYGLLYGMPEKDNLRAFRYDNSTRQLATAPLARSVMRSPDGMPGAFLSLSANGRSSGIVWASVPKMDGQWQNVPGRLVAFDALTLAELWRDDDDIGFPKFTPPTVAGGKVFRPTFANKLVVYGLKAGPTAPPCYTIDQKHQNYTGNEGLLGAPNGAETVAADGVGHFRHYAGGSIYWTPATCAWELHGSIRNLWASLGWERSLLGYPLTDETVTPDGRGRYNHFQGGSIYWTPATGAHEVHGLIRNQWAALGWERGALGYPLSDETDEVDGSGRFNVFEHGTVHWRRSDNAVTVHANAGLLMSPAHANVDRPGQDIARTVLPENSVAMCQQQCADNSACVSWSLVRPGVQGPSAVCWLKGAAPLEQANACCTSGIKVAMQPAGMSAMLGRIDRPGADFASFDLPSADPLLCQGECGRNGSCRAWTYVEPQGAAAARCWMKSAITGAVANGMTVSGTR